jgi:hypothetical protein
MQIKAAAEYAITKGVKLVITIIRTCLAPPSARSAVEQWQIW